MMGFSRIVCVGFDLMFIDGSGVDAEAIEIWKG
jgi:hypothetical protein